MLSADIIAVYARLATAYSQKEYCIHGKSRVRTCQDCERMKIQDKA